ncbi:COMM domain-containing protein 10 [Eudromia elegans]
MRISKTCLLNTPETSNLIPHRSQVKLNTRALAPPPPGLLGTARLPRGLPPPAARNSPGPSSPHPPSARSARTRPPKPQRAGRGLAPPGSRPPLPGRGLCGSDGGARGAGDREGLPPSRRPLLARSIRRAVSLLNAVPPGRFPRLLSRLLQKLHLKAESSFSEEEEEKLQAAFSLEKQDLHLILETISFILEQAVYHNLKPATLQQQLQSIHLDEDKAEAFASAWAAAGQDTIEKFRQRVLTPQKLETIGWQLNLQMAESMQAKLKSPRAVLELGVSNEDSKSLKKVFAEFSHQELFEFYNKLETIQAQLDSLT